MSLWYAIPWYSTLILMGQPANVCSNNEDARVGTLLEIRGIRANLITGGSGLFIIVIILLLLQFPLQTSPHHSTPHPRMSQTSHCHSSCMMSGTALWSSSSGGTEHGP